MQSQSTIPGKQQEFRRYLAGSGIASALISFFRDLRANSNAKADGLEMLRKHFGDYRHPAFDIAAALEVEKSELKRRLDISTIKEEELRISIKVAERSLVGKKLVEKLGNKTGDIPREFVIKCLLGPVVAKRCNPQLLAIVPKTIDGSRIRRYIESSDAAYDISRLWVDVSPESPAWENGNPSDEMAAFWKGYSEFEI